MPKRKRPNFTGVWLTETGKAALQERAREEGRSLSALLRAMIAYAVQRMPRGWNP